MLVGATIMSIQKQNIFSNGTQQKQATEHEREAIGLFTETRIQNRKFCKISNPKIESVQIAWDETQWDEIEMVRHKEVAKLLWSMEDLIIYQTQAGVRLLSLRIKKF